MAAPLIANAWHFYALDRITQRHKFRSILCAEIAIGLTKRESHRLLDTYLVSLSSRRRGVPHRHRTPGETAMQNPSDTPGFDTLVEAIAAKLSDRALLGSVGNPAPTLPQVWERPQIDPQTDFLIGAKVGIAGVEYTQSIQYNGSSGPSYGVDNAVPLVAYKTMVVRAFPFVRRGALGGDTLTGQRVTGELTLSIGNRVLYHTGPTRTDGARLGPASSIDRGNWDREFTLIGGGGSSLSVEHSTIVNSTLNFVVPAYYCRLGRIYATVRLWPVADGSTSARATSAVQYLQFIDVQAPKVCLVRVNWVDGAGKVNRPTDREMLDTLGLAGRMLPFPYFESMILGTETTSSAPFAMVSASAGGCNVSWSNLVADLNVTRIFTTLFQLGDIVFGMVPKAAIPAGPGSINSGCGRGAGGGFVGYDTTFAHEIGHLYGRPHVAVPGDATSDPNYPNYGGSARSIGEVGIDTGTVPPTLFDPSGSDDLMSYGNNQWVSPYTYQKILEARSMHQSVRIDPSRLRPLLVLDFRVYRAVKGQSYVEIRKAIGVQAAGMAPPKPLGGLSPVSLDLFNGNGLVLATHHCTWAPAHGGGNCGCCGHDVPLGREPWLDFQEVIEWPAEVASIAFHKGEDPFHTLFVGEPPLVSIEGPERREANLIVRVRTSHPRERVSIVVLFSGNDGVTWQPVAFDPSDGEVVIEAGRLPGGGRCLFRAIGTAELQSATADTQPFELPREPRRLYLELPSKECGIPPGPVALTAMVDTRGLGAITPADIRWSSSIDGELGFGYALTPDLSEGRHELTATAPDGLGGMLTERAIIIVSGRPQ
jgi:hypothetical protein